MTKKKKHADAINEERLGAWIAVGTGVGVALGVALDSLAMGLPLGAALGTTIGLVRCRQHDCDRDQ